MLSCKESKFCGVQTDKAESSVFAYSERAENILPTLTETSIPIECQENNDNNSSDFEDESSDTEKHMSWNEVIPPKPPAGWGRSFAQLKMTWTMIENKSMAKQGNNDKRETKIKNSEDEPEEGRNNKNKSEGNKKCEEQSQEKKKESKNNMEQEDSLNHLEPSLEPSIEVKVTECLENDIEEILQYNTIQTTNKSLEMTNECTQHLEHEQKLTEILHKCKELFIDYQVEQGDAGPVTSLPED